MSQPTSLPVHGSAVVTGASRGIGRAVALELAAAWLRHRCHHADPAAGASMPEEAKGSLQVRRLDVTDPSTFDLPGDLRVLVNNAGIDIDYLPVEHANVDDWRRLFETNVFGVVALTSAAIPILRANPPAVVCTVSSSSIFASVPFYAAYRASKAAVSAFDDSLRMEVAPFGIRVVEILPGPVDTDMFRLSTASRTPRVSSTTARSGPRRPGCARSMPIPGWSMQPMQPSPSSMPSSRATVRCATAATPSPTSCSSSGAGMTTRRSTS